ncbi:hypothetical protein PUR57_14460 [Streptomyces sp. JV176]|uniref:terpene synthase family protein n=1 Tax=Streptomyces sp. JV176 TaxID=858630 RepID=UPI002E78122F|nr:hypothetical protein [Streptomyces sp. JV176]MEE1799856.1 hypothetical protein [Streptomyces sp. JV176]
MSLPYRVPALYWLLPTARHPRAEELIRRVDEELTIDGALSEPRYRTAFDTLGLGELVPQCHPAGDLEGAVEAAVIAAWAFLADNPQGDQWMPNVLIPDVEYLQGEALLARSLDPGVYERITHPLERSVANSLRKLAAYTSPGKVSLCAAAMIEWFVAEFEDMRLRAKGTPPSLDDAVRIRCITHAGPVVEAYTAATFPRLTLEEAAAPEIRAIWQLQALTWSVHNDLYSGLRRLRRQQHPDAGLHARTRHRPPGSGRLPRPVGGPRRPRGHRARRRTRRNRAAGGSCTSRSSPPPPRALPRSARPTCWPRCWTRPGRARSPRRRSSVC